MTAQVVKPEPQLKTDEDRAREEIERAHRPAPLPKNPSR